MQLLYDHYTLYLSNSEEICRGLLEAFRKVKDFGYLQWSCLQVKSKRFFLVSALVKV